MTEQVFYNSDQVKLKEYIIPDAETKNQCGEHKYQKTYWGNKRSFMGTKIAPWETQASEPHA